MKCKPWVFSARINGQPAVTLIERTLAVHERDLFEFGGRVWRYLWGFK